jgi:hypothetical protein
MVSSNKKFVINEQDMAALFSHHGRPSASIDASLYPPPWGGDFLFNIAHIGKFISGMGE